MNPSARTAAQVLRLRARATRAEARSRRPENPAKLAKSCQTRARSLMTHALAAGVDPATAKSVVSALRSAAERKNIKPTEKARTRLGWEPALSYEESIERSVRWYLEHESALAVAQPA